MTDAPELTDLNYEGYDTASYGVLVADSLFEDGGPVVRYANAAMAALIGNRFRARLTGQPLDRLLKSGAPDWPSFPDQILIDTAAGRPWAGPLYRSGSDNEAVAHFATHPVRQPDGSISALVALQIEPPVRNDSSAKAQTGSGNLSGSQFRNEVLFGRIFQNAADAIIVCDEKLQIIEFNTGAETIFGYSGTEIVGRPLDCLIPGRHRHVHASLVARFAAEPTTSRHMSERSEISGLRRNGEEFPCEASIVRVEHDGGNIFAAIVRDLTHRQAQEAELREAFVRAQQADAAKSRFLATVSHELRTPLNGVIGFSEFALSEISAGNGHDRCEEYLEHVLTSGRQLSNIIEGILSITEIESEAHQWEMLPFDIEDALVETARGVPRESERVRVEGSRGLLLSANRWAICQIVHRLIDNALKFSEEPEPVTVRIETSPAGEVTISVHDRGIGFPEDQLHRLGEPFFQIDDTHTRRWGGLGLGFYTAQKLASAQGAELKLRNNSDRGITVSLLLPAGSAQQRRPAGASNERPSHQIG